MWMNSYEVEAAALSYASDPVLGPAVLTLRSLQLWADSNSDGWAYWPKPARAASTLMTLVNDEHRRRQGRWNQSASLALPATSQDVAKALRPIKAFRTRTGADFVIVEPAKGCVVGL